MNWRKSIIALGAAGAMAGLAVVPAFAVSLTITSATYTIVSGPPAEEDITVTVTGADSGGGYVQFYVNTGSTGVGVSAASLPYSSTGSYTFEVIVPKGGTDYTYVKAEQGAVSCQWTQMTETQTGQMPEAPYAAALPLLALGVGFGLWQRQRRVNRQSA